jgi:hypothetical protein
MKPSSHFPEYIRLRKVPWQICATLGFESRAAAVSFGKKAFFAWMRTLAKSQRAYFPRVFFAYRLENGQSGDHWHYHALVGGLGVLPPGFFEFADASWTRFNKRFARITQFDPQRDGVGYIMKAPAGYSSPHRLRDEELVTPTLSDSVLAYLRCRIR